MSTDQAIEAEIQAKGLTAARITPHDVESAIASEHYFTAAQGDLKAQEDAAFATGARDCVQARPTPQPLGRLTFCVLVLRNGFTVTGESACVSTQNVDADVGKKIARTNAVNKVWPLLGYQLRSMLARKAEAEAVRGAG